MAIAFDVGSWGPTAADYVSGANWSHAGSASARAACVMIGHDSAGTGDLVSAVTYGGAAMTRVRSDEELTEAGRVYIYWLDNVATGTQNVVATHSAGFGVRLGVFTMTVTAGASVALDGNATGTSASVANPSWSMTTGGGSTLCGEVIHSGLQTMTTTPAAGWSLVVAGALGVGSAYDAGTTGRGFAFGAFSGTPVTCGWTAATAEDFVASSVAFKEVAAAANRPPKRAVQMRTRTGVLTSRASFPR